MHVLNVKSSECAKNGGEIRDTIGWASISVVLWVLDGSVCFYVMIQRLDEERYSSFHVSEKYVGINPLIVAAGVAGNLHHGCVSSVTPELRLEGDLMFPGVECK